MRHRRTVAVCALVAAFTSSAPLAAAAPIPGVATPSSPIVNFFTDDFWLNLHHFLYVLGRAEAKTPDSERDGVNEAPVDQNRGLERLSATEQSIWRETVTAYAAGISKRDAVSDRTMVSLTGALAQIGDAQLPDASATGLTGDAVALFTRAAPIYRKAWWPAHHRANREWVTAMQPMVDKHGAAVLAFITKVYGLPWLRGGYPVHLSGYTNWAGAYSTDGPLLVIASLDPGNRGTDGLELIFHESMHQWDEPIQTRLREIGTTLRKRVRPSLSHALIWMTAGEAIRRVVPGYVSIADRGIWERADYPALKPMLDATWLPYLHGAGTRDEALTALMNLAGR